MIQPAMVAVWYASTSTADMYVIITGRSMGEECDDTAPTIPASHGVSPDPKRKQNQLETTNRNENVPEFS